MNVAADILTRKFIGAVEDEWQLYSDNASDYEIGSPIGFGASSTVYAAKYNPPTTSVITPCALKVLDLDRLPGRSLRLLQRETQLMSLAKHPNVLRVRGTWMDGHKLYIALRLMNAGSAADVMRYGWPGGMEEEVVKCILRQALEGINYLHINGFIHRDIKAANFLIDDDGTVLLGDLGVAAFLLDAEDSSNTPGIKQTVNPSSSSTLNPRHVGQYKPRYLGKRKSFVGTPCWMAPEVIAGKQYDASADIWSFGITALELAQGRAPRSREKPHSVLLNVVQKDPPTLDRNGGVHKYSRAFEEMVTMCLNKDPSLRPTAAELLDTHFFKSAKKKSYLVGAILSGLPPLTQRQERRKQPSILTSATMESWDFSVTSMASPTTSVHSRQSKRPKSTLPSDGVFEIEDDAKADSDEDENQELDIESEKQQDSEGAAAYAHRMRRRHGLPHQHHPRSHSRSVSWAEEDDPPHTGTALSHSRDHSHAHPEPIQEVDIPPLSSSPNPILDSVDHANENEKSDGAANITLSQSPPSTTVPAAGFVRAAHDNLLLPSTTHTHAPSTSPALSSASASISSATSDSNEQTEPLTPPSSLPHPSHHRLWKRLSKWRMPRSEDREEESEGVGETVTTRKKSFGSNVLGLTRTVSRGSYKGSSIIGRSTK
ncbi:protein kinase superfamily protein [Abortiporus biennis]